MAKQLQLVLKHLDRVTTSSMIVAEMFQVEHDLVIDLIKSLECSDDFRSSNFELSSYGSGKKKLPMYFITKDGFMMLGMLFPGTTAATFREKFIDAFNEMERALFESRMPILIPVYQTRMLSNPTRRCPDDRWCIFDQAGEIMLLIEKEIGSVNEFDLADGSIGLHWMSYRVGKPWANTVTQYWHEFRDVRGPRLANSFDYSELKHFKIWLKSIYKTNLLYAYLQNKFKNDKLMLPRVEAFIAKYLKGGDSSKGIS